MKSSRSLFKSVLVRSFSSSCSQNASPTVKEVGRFIAPLHDTHYAPGQIFLSKTFAYRGIVVCSFDCRFHERKASTSDKSSSQKTYYQVLIHRQDWPYMRFPVDMTSYLMDGTSRGEKLLTMINGMDCIEHSEIIPFSTIERNPIDHDLFDRIFTISDGEFGKERVITMQPKLLENYMSSQKSWLAPRDIFKEVTENVEVTVITFYLGPNMVSGQQRHMWRYVIRIENTDLSDPVILRERALKVYSLNNMNQASGHGVVGKQPELNKDTPVFQYSSTIELPHSKGGHMWGRFKMERGNGSTFDAAIPTIMLESFDEKPHEVAEKIGE